MSSDTHNLSSVKKHIHLLHKDRINEVTDEQKAFLLDGRRFGSYVEKNQHLISWLEANHRGLTLESLIEFVEHLSDRRSSTVNVARSQAKRIVREIVAEDPDSFSILDVWKIERVLGTLKSKNKQNNNVLDDKILSDDEIRRLAYRARPWASCIIAVLGETGIRVSELINWELSDCNLKTDRIDVTISGKGRKQRTFYVSIELWNQIREQYPHKHGYVFQTKNGRRYTRQQIWQMLKKEGERTLGRSVHPHMLRHSFATRMIQAGYDLKAVSSYLGHSTTTITADMYVHTSIKPDQIVSFARRGNGTND
jgi:integrase